VKSLRMLGLAAFAAMALMSVGAGTASADTLCKANEDPCSAANRYEVGETVKASTTELVLSGVFALPITCGSELTAQVTEDLGGGAGLELEVTSLTVSGCSASCEAMEATGLPYSGEASAKTQAVTLSGGPNLKLSGCQAMKWNCGYESAESVLQLKGGAPGHLAVEGLPLGRTFGNCGAVAKLTADYEISSPSSVWLVKFAAGGADTLCKAAETPCAAENQYAAGQTIKASAKQWTLKGPPGATFSVTCESSLEGKVTNAGSSSEAVEIAISAMSFANCSGSCKSGTASGLPLDAIGSGQTLVLAEGSGGVPKVTLGKCLALQQSCSYALSGIVLAFEGGGPAHLLATGAPVTRLSGACNASSTVTADYELSSPSPAWLVGA
jgi:hypothetical protein